MEKQMHEIKQEEEVKVFVPAATQSDEYDEMVAYKTLRQKRKKKVAIRILIYALIILFLPVFIFFTVVVVSPNSGHNLFGYKFYIVATHSMEPELMVGDCIVVKNVKSAEEISIGDDISFVRVTDGEIVTHRVVEIQKTGNDTKYVTKGVNSNTNPTPDEQLVKFENVLGKRVANLAVLGQIITFFRSPLGVVIMVLLFLAIVGGFVVSFKLSEDIKAIGK